MPRHVSRSPIKTLRREGGREIKNNKHKHPLACNASVVVIGIVFVVNSLSFSSLPLSLLTLWAPLKCTDQDATVVVSAHGPIWGTQIPE